MLLGLGSLKKNLEYKFLMFFLFFRILNFINVIYVNIVVS